LPVRRADRAGAAGDPARGAARPLPRMDLRGGRGLGARSAQPGEAARGRSGCARCARAISAGALFCLQRRRTAHRCGLDRFQRLPPGRSIAECVMASITIWNRVEPRARATDMKAGLEARVHDPLWLLARQWQVGEFATRDAGSPVSAEVKSAATVLDRYTTGAEPARP